MSVPWTEEMKRRSAASGLRQDCHNRGLWLRIAQQQAANGPGPASPQRYICLRGKSMNGQL